MSHEQTHETTHEATHEESKENSRRIKIANRIRSLRSSRRIKKQALPYMNPYVAGVIVGLILFLSFFLIGKGLGGSGAYARIVAFSMDKVAPAHTETLGNFQRYLGSSKHVFDDWLFYMFIGVFFGGLTSGILGNRFKKEILRGPNISNRGRLGFAFLGGILVALGSRLAGGCTSGLALTGGAMLGVAGWVFFFSIMVSGLFFGYLVRKQWL